MSQSSVPETETQSDFAAWQFSLGAVVPRPGSDIVVYTAIMNDYDELMEPEYMPPGVDFVCFTDDPDLRSRGWHLVLVDFRHRDPRRLAKIFKVLPHLFLQNYRTSIWVDANISVTGDIRKLVESHLDAPGAAMACLAHDKRSCAYEEAAECLRWGKDAAPVIRRQVERYHAAGYPRGSGLIQGRILFRDHNAPHTREVMEAWWGEIEKFSVRDQISFNFIAWKHSFRVERIGIQIADNPFFQLHLRPRMVTYGAEGKPHWNLRSAAAAAVNWAVGLLRR